MMKKLFGRAIKTLATTVLLSIAIATDNPNAKALSLIQKDLFFGRNITGGAEVSEKDFEMFLDREITPRFPAGLTIFDADGQFQDSMGNLIEERSKVLTLFAEDIFKNEIALDEIVIAYLQQFSQESVLQVTNKDELMIAFGAGENLINNTPIPKFIEVDLFFGRNIPGGGEVSETQFQAFVDLVITPRFSARLTIFDAQGHFQDSTGIIIEERSKAVKLLFEDTLENENSLKAIIDAYVRQFNQESVLIAVNEDVAVGFGAGENLIDNDRIPEFIGVDLFFGRNIAGGGEVSETQFQTFVDRVITPRFPARLTIFDAQGQFQDSTGTIIEERSKAVKLLLEDTVSNENSLDEIIKTYIQQFNQESVLLVVDEDLEVAFDASASASIPEPSLIPGLFVLSALGIGFLLKHKSPV
jgi:transcription termination factor NusB